MCVCLLEEMFSRRVTECHMHQPSNLQMSTLKELGKVGGLRRHCYQAAIAQALTQCNPQLPETPEHKW